MGGFKTSEAVDKAKQKFELRERRVTKGEASLAEAEKRLAGDRSAFDAETDRVRAALSTSQQTAKELSRLARDGSAEAEAMKARYEKALASMKVGVAAA